MQVITADILSMESGIIGHQVNCRRVMSAGLAKQVKSKFPQVFTSYSKHCSATCLGKVQAIRVSDELVIANLFAQLNYGTSSRQTDYDAMRSCLTKLVEYRDSHFPNLPIYLPFGIGCGLAGGDWDVVSQMIEEIIPDAILCKLN